MDKLINELKSRIIEVLGLKNVTPEGIEPDEPLVGGRLGIDSIDVLEIVMMVEEDFGVTIENREIGEKVLASVKALATHIQRNIPEPGA